VIGFGQSSLLKVKPVEPPGNRSTTRKDKSIIERQKEQLETMKKKLADKGNELKRNKKKSLGVAARLHDLEERVPLIPLVKKVKPNSETSTNVTSQFHEYYMKQLFDRDEVQRLALSAVNAKQTENMQSLMVQMIDLQNFKNEKCKNDSLDDKTSFLNL